ncbi:MAG: aminotransferase class V-fold PLP-dependent enzyme [Gemmatimonadetes bacterium]|nr:aminotransferase class V-fold PLP-dependent enzyme [Gemmatimonadota bacterium]MBT7863210.1 aminotransferase class V-fold PLP-dependent enzyme [Gemmatimonadota bacterium]
MYEAIGLETIINCRGTFTILGGSAELPEVLGAMEAASGFFIQYDELAAAVGQRLADITGAEWGMVSSGCAAGMKHITMACVTGGNPERLIRIPDLSGLEKTQVIVPRWSRNNYDHALRNVGIEMVMVDSPEEMERAINHRTAMIYMVTGNDQNTSLPLQEMARIAKPHGIPILADAAAENLTIPNIHLERGATVVSYSGGKALCGPQAAGLNLGRKDLLQAAWQASAPHHGPGRDDKCGKEEILGMLAAVEAWITRDHEAEWQSWLEKLGVISARVGGIDGVETSVQVPDGLNNRAPRLVIEWDPAVLHITGEQVAEDFARKAPRVAVGSGDADGRASINITPSQMQPGNEQVVAERVHAILTAKREPLSDELQQATSSVAGGWDVEVEYATSTSQHHWTLEQDGNWLSGYHVTEFDTLPIHGVLEADGIKLESHVRRPGNWIPFMFDGTVTGDTMAGSIFLGEYQTAKFTAKRAAKPKRSRVTIPGGPPLAT